MASDWLNLLLWKSMEHRTSLVLNTLEFFKRQQSVRSRVTIAGSWANKARNLATLNAALLSHELVVLN
jgi:hypothetical protein